MEDIMKIVKSLEDSGLLLKGISGIIQNEVKEQKGGFLSMLLGTLGASLFVNVFTGKGFIRAGYGSKGKGVLRAGYRSKKSLIKDFYYCLVLSLILKYKSIIRINLDLMELILEIICLIE